MINPVWLRSFCTLVETGHFTHTAEKLFMTQSGVSQHIRKLEQYLDQPLITRHSKKFTLTNAGERLYSEANTIVQSLTDLDKRISEDPSYVGVVRLASPGSIGLKLYPQLLAFQQQHPDLIIDYRFAPNHEIEKMIAEQRIDVGLMTSLAGKGEVKLNHIGSEDLLLVTPAHITTASWENLLKLGFINHPDGIYHASQLLSVNFPEFQHIEQFKQSGFSNQISLIVEPVKLGLGFTVLPRYAVEAFHQQEAINTFSLTHQVSEKIYLGTHANKFVPNRVNTVIEQIKAYLATH
ncbi:LysR family transcriptional regulator [Photobacterium leiognathi]|uniref:LysR family transcriptional regulator n=1 Tax=Photobacterium leiognathi subsp. mandapamensis TaxID=48408 RepID=A0A2T3KWG2_PHOLD|nr:LysR family transcriptional regulator [Photobacterium leiognathi]PSV11744.1 LysR family transcriptional regulator [Photobacterium leiognathi subsp. mandapamensis]